MIGPDHRSLFVPEELLANTGAYFSTLLRGGFKEGQSKEPIKLEEDKYTDWEAFYYFLLYGRLGMFERLLDRFERLADHWIFADRIGQSAFANEIMTIISVSFIRRYSGPDRSSLMPTLLSIYDRTPPGSKLLKILAEAVAMEQIQEKAYFKDVKGHMNDEDFQKAYLDVLHKYARQSTRGLDQAFRAQEFHFIT